MGLGVAGAEDDSFGFLQRFRVFLFCLVFVCLDSWKMKRKRKTDGKVGE